jgi:hypothetical protein
MSLAEMGKTCLPERVAVPEPATVKILFVQELTPG